MTWCVSVCVWGLCQAHYPTRATLISTMSHACAATTKNGSKTAFGTVYGCEGVAELFVTLPSSAVSVISREALLSN